MAYQTRCRPVGPDPQSDPAVAEAAELLSRGELVAFPTETVYGLGADATDEAAVRKIFIAKQRPADNPLIVHIGHPELVAQYCERIPPDFEKLAAAFWPGSLTLVLPAVEALHHTVCRGLETIALRMPNHPVALALLSKVGRGIAAPSANLSGRPSPTRAKHVMDDLNGRLPLILDGGPCAGGLESTVLDLSEGAPVILRPGLVTSERIAEVLGHPVSQPSDQQREKRSPGTRYKHYAPNASVLIIGAGLSASAFDELTTFLKHRGPVGYFGLRPRPAGIGPELWHHCEPKQLAAELYHQLRDLDERGPQYIFVDDVTHQGEGVSIRDRLSRAATARLDDEGDVRALIQQIRKEEDA